MSKNYELLLQVEKDPEVLAAFRNSGPANGNHSRSRLEARGRAEVMKLVERAFLLARPEAPRVVVFSAVESGDGCSSICAGAAAALGEQGEDSCCVVDANLRAPSLHRYFGLENHWGLVEALRESGPIRDFAQQAPSHRLWVLTSGSVCPGSARLLHGDRLRSRLAELREEFGTIVLDTPPLKSYDDAIALGQQADGLILVLRSETTRREAARQAKVSLASAQVRLLGAVLNDRTYPIPQALYERI